MQITSSDFQDQDPIPNQFSRNGEDKSPSLTFSQVPDGAESLALIVEDPDAPGGMFTHWIIYNMSPGTLQIVAGELPMSGQQGTNDYNENRYGGPQPPSGTHHYVFKLFALDQMLDFDRDRTIDRQTLYDAMQGHVIEQAELTGTFSA